MDNLDHDSLSVIFHHLTNQTLSSIALTSGKFLELACEEFERSHRRTLTLRPSGNLNGIRLFGQSVECLKIIENLDSAEWQRLIHMADTDLFQSNEIECILRNVNKYCTNVTSLVIHARSHVAEQLFASNFFSNVASRITSFSIAIIDYINPQTLHTQMSKLKNAETIEFVEFLSGRHLETVFTIDFPHLKTFRFAVHTVIPKMSEFLSFLRRHTKLNSLTMDGWSATAKQLIQIRRCAPLQEMSLSVCRIDPAQIDDLQILPISKFKAVYCPGRTESRELLNNPALHELTIYDLLPMDPSQEYLLSDQVRLFSHVEVLNYVGNPYKYSKNWLTNLPKLIKHFPKLKIIKLQFEKSYKRVNDKLYTAIVAACKTSNRDQILYIHIHPKHSQISQSTIDKYDSYVRVELRPYIKYLGMLPLKDICIG